MTSNQIATLPSLIESARQIWTRTERTGGNPASHATILLVTDGYHAGATLDFENRAYTLGSDVESDILLADPGIAENHLVLRRNRSRLDVEAVGGDVLLNDGELIPEGHGRSCRLPVTLKVGEAILTIEAPQSSFPFSLPEIPRSALPFVIAAIVIVGLFAVSFAANGVTLSDSEAGIQVAALSDADTSLAESVPASSQAAVELKARIAQAGLSGLVVEETADRLVVTGNIAGERSAEWTDIQAWYDRSFGTQTILSSSVESQAAEAMPRLKLRAIWFGDNPYVISADGARYYEGAFTNDGWSVAEIGEDRLLLKKGSAQFALTYP